jgi:uncharacterized protein (DUF433 family)
VASPNIVTGLSEVIENIGNYNSAIAKGKLRDVIAYVRHWYAFKEGGSWQFAPSKFIGYASITPAIYQREHKELDGRIAESALKQWFEEIPEGHVLKEELQKELRRFIASHGKSLNSLAQIHVLKSQLPDPVRKKSAAAGETWRITANPDMLGGKPCIRGLRIRVTDILEALALGATRAEILEDFPYLEDGDVTAALEYAVGSVDHRLVKAA